MLTAIARSVLSVLNYIEAYSLQAGGVILSVRWLDYCSSRDDILNFQNGGKAMAMDALLSREVAKKMPLMLQQYK